MSDASDKPEPRKSPDLRASDADRDRVAALLRDAAGEGRISLDEVDERLTAVYAAKTYSELAEVTADLPVGDTPRAPAPADAAASGYTYGGTPTSTVGIGILGGFQRKGYWTVPRRFTSVTIMGGGEIDLREARFADRDVTIVAVAIMGGVNVIVPEDAEVNVTGIGIMGGFDHTASGPGRPGAPRITITGFAFWGGVGTERRPTRAQLSDRRAAERDRRELNRNHHHPHDHDGQY
ncbi:MAG TPA: DUF1707 domain-containing protein [Streptosporangiaceae bacterium]